MANKLYLWQEPRIRRDGQVIASIALEQAGQPRKRLWYRVPEAFAFAMTESCDPFVLGTIFKAMRDRADLIVRGEVSPTLLRNLEEFQAVWALWLPQKYQPIEIITDAAREQTPAKRDAAICAFSGGVDATFTVWRHRAASRARSRRNLQAGILVHGFDIPLQETQVLEYTLARSRAMLSSIGMDVIPIATNLRQFADAWYYEIGAGVISCLTLLQGGWNTGLIASTRSYDKLKMPLGTTPLTDPWLSTGAFSIVHDGAGVPRIEKIRALAGWAEACANLRVCWQGNQRDNCCRCRKCIRTILEFRAVGAGLPKCFSRDVGSWQILTTGSAAVEHDFLAETAATTKAEGITGAWVWATRLASHLSRVRRAGKKIFARQH
jgi:hypothetical protein